MSEESPYSGQEEDRIDRWFNRKLAYPVAVVFARLGVHPNVVSIVGMMLGVASGWWFQFQDATVLWGVGLLVVSTILDNADGMVARMTNKSSEFGYILDGVCDNFVFISVYVGGIYGMWAGPMPWGGTWGAWAWVLACAAGFSHGRQSAMLDFYKMQWRYWACQRDGARFKTSAEVAERRTRASGIARLFMGMHVAHARRQESMARRRLALAPQMEAARSRSGFSDRYASLNRLPMKGWFFMGPNWHVIAVCVFALIGRFDLYCWSQILLFNGALLATFVLQRVRDRALLAA